MRTLVLKNKRLQHEHSNEFRQIFGTGLKEWMDDVMGFDIVGFDDQFIQSGDGCMQDAIKGRYGTRAVELIRLLIGAT